MTHTMTQTKQLLRKARTLYNVPYTPASTNKHNRHQWVRSVIFLGDNWHLAKTVGRLQ